MFGTKRKISEIGDYDYEVSVNKKVNKSPKKPSKKEDTPPKKPSKKIDKKVNKKNDKDIPKFFFLDLLFDNPMNKSGNKKVEEQKISEKSVVNTCNNPLCSHKTKDEEPEMEKAFKINIDEIKSINDLIYLGKKYHCKKQTTYNGLNLRLMCNLVSPLIELRDMVGLKDVKKKMVDQILFFLQGFNTSLKCNNCNDCAFELPCVQTNTEMMHTSIIGPAGVGKTSLARIIGKVYKAMGILSKGQFREATRNDFIDKYLGHTADKTQRFIDSCSGGVLFIDEAYALGHKEQRDSFSKEALDTLNKNLSDNRDLLCIIAGYEKDLEECFFSANEGLRRRFTFKYVVEGYDYKELKEMFELKVKLENWYLDIDDDELMTFFRNNKDKFPHYGGDIETLFLQCKIAHGKRMPENKKYLSFSDIELGFNNFVSNRKHKKLDKKGEEEKRPNIYIL